MSAHMDSAIHIAHGVYYECKISVHTALCLYFTCLICHTRIDQSSNVSLGPQSQILVTSSFLLVESINRHNNFRKVLLIMSAL